MRCAVAIVGFLLAACSGDGGTDLPTDARIDAHQGLPCANTQPGGPVCGMSCGNNQVDTCWVDVQSPMDGCPRWVPGGQDFCEGDDRPTCEATGFYGGTSGCIACVFDSSGCDACASSTTSCTTLDPITLNGEALAVSGAHLALVSVNAITIVDGNTTTRVDLEDVHSAVGTPGGWLIAHGTPLSLTPLSTSGVLGTTQTTNANAYAWSMAYGPGGRVLVAHNELVASAPHTTARLVDTTGATVVTTFDLFSNGRPTSVTSDGTNFFVGGNGYLARVSPDGSHRVVSGLPTDSTAGTPEIVRVLWSGTAGWFVATTYTANDPRIRAQRFDSNGDLVGTAIAPTSSATAWAFTTDGSDLVAIKTESQVTTRRLSLVHIDGGGSVGVPVEIGVGADPVRVTRAGADVLIVWSRPGHLQVARVTP